MKRALWFFLLPTTVLTAAPEVLTYEQALQVIIDRSTDIDSQKQTLAQLKARNLPSHLALLPGISLEGRRDTNNNNQLLPDVSGGVSNQSVTTSRLGGSARGDLNLFRFGGDLAGMKAANSEELSQELSVDDSVLKTESSGARAINALIQSQKEVEILHRAQDIREQVLVAARERFRRGLLAEQEVSKVEVDFANDRAQLRDGEAELIRADAELVSQLGNDGVQREWPWQEKLQQANLPLLSLTDKVLSNRPDWRAAQAKVKGSRERQTQSLAKALPSLDLSASYGYFHSESDGQSLTGPELSAALVLSIPLFDRLSNYGNYESQVHTVSLAELEFEKLKRSVLSEWTTAKGALEISLRSVKDRVRTLSLARRVYDDNLQRFRRGLASVNDLSLDQGRLITSERLTVQGWSAVHTNFVRLCNAVGRRVKDCWNE